MNVTPTISKKKVEVVSVQIKDNYLDSFEQQKLSFEEEVVR